MNEGLPSTRFRKIPPSLTTISSLSKAFALVLFIALPFLGGWIGYTLAPEKDFEVESIVQSQRVSDSKGTDEMIASTVTDAQVNPLVFKNLPHTQGVLAYLQFAYDDILKGETVQFDLVDHTNKTICKIGSDKLDEHSGEIVWLPTFSDLSACPSGTVSTQYKIRTMLNGTGIGYSEIFTIAPSYPLDTQDVRPGFLRFEDPERGYSFTYPGDWHLRVAAVTDYRRQGYIQLHNYDVNEITSDTHGWAERENKVEWGRVKSLSDVSSYDVEILSGRRVYTEQGGIDGGGDWKSFALQYPDQPERVIFFTIYGDTDNFQSVLEIFLQDFELTQPNITD